MQATLPTMHQYFVSDGSGMSQICVNTDVGVERDTTRLRDNNKKRFYLSLGPEVMT